MTKEVLIVKDFSVLKELRLEINNFNVILGDQATGKSLISKLVYFFQEIIPETFKLTSQKDFRTFVNNLEKIFFQIFPAYFWEKQNFYIEFNYRLPDTFVIISKKKNTNLPKINFEFSERIKRRFNELKIKQITNFNLFEDLLNKEVFKTFNTHLTIFTPASRSFFSLVQENIFSLNLLGITTDLFINKFGAFYEFFKKFPSIEDEIIKEMFKNVLKGEFYFDDKQKEIFIYDNNQRKSRLRDSSTGQQELVPILILLNVILMEKNFEHFIIIEEPGSHLFPKTQKRLTELFAAIYNKTNRKCGFFFTTHTPYIMASLNNLIEADNIAKQIKNQKQKKLLENIIPAYKHLDFEDISAFWIENGTLKDIKDYELKMIKADLLDNVSEEISEEFSKLLELEQKLKNE